MGINILLREGMGMFLYTTMGMGWKWEYGNGNGREWDRKSHFRTSQDESNYFFFWLCHFTYFEKGELNLSLS